MKLHADMDDKEFKQAVLDAGLAADAFLPEDCRFVLCVIPLNGDKAKFAATIPEEDIAPELERVAREYRTKENK